MNADDSPFLGAEKLTAIICGNTLKFYVKPNPFWASQKDMLKVVVEL